MSRTVRVPTSTKGTYAKIRPKLPRFWGRKKQKVTSIKYIVNKYIIIYYCILLYSIIIYYYYILYIIIILLLLLLYGVLS